MMNLFSVIADQVRNRQELFDEEGSIMQKLVDAGYSLHQADAALRLMQTLVQKQDETFFGHDGQRGIRTMSTEERRRFTADGFAFAQKLTHLGVFGEDQCEELIEKAMRLYKGRIELEHVKALVAFMLFTSSREREDAESVKKPRIKDTAWN